MVNTGHPSRACDPCKARHTKCDERRPQCARCTRSGRRCTGYKNDIDINLRNETYIVARRVRARKVQSQNPRNAMYPPYGQQAIAVVLENFVLDASNAGYSRGYLACLPTLLRSTASDSLLTCTVDALGLCFLSAKTANVSVASRAARSYVRSLNRLQTMLDQGVDCMSTETIISVYLMGLYEMIIPPEKTVHPWLAHLQGLTALTKAGQAKTSRQSPDTDVLIALDKHFDQSAWARGHIVPTERWSLDHSDRNERIFHNGFVTQGALKPNMVADDRSISTILDDLILRTEPVLEAAPSLTKNSDSGTKADVQALMTAARSQLLRLRAWPSETPNHWHPRPVHHHINASELPQLEIFPGRIDVYPDLHVAALWNTYRTTLLRLCDVVAQCGRYLEAETVPFQETVEYQGLRAEAMRTSESICSSVAFHINNDWLSRITNTSLPKSPRAVGSLFLIWPLYAGSILSIVPKVHRIWMRRKLRSIGTTMGLAQATVLADTVDLWDHTDPFKPLIISQGHVFMWSASMF